MSTDYFDKLLGTKRETLEETVNRFVRVISSRHERLETETIVTQLLTFVKEHLYSLSDNDVRKIVELDVEAVNMWIAIAGKEEHLKALIIQGNITTGMIKNMLHNPNVTHSILIGLKIHARTPEISKMFKELMNVGK